MSGVPPLPTVDRTLVPGAALRGGTVGAYRAVADAPGEPHVVRTELAGGSPTGTREIPAHCWCSRTPPTYSWSTSSHPPGSSSAMSTWTTRGSTTWSRCTDPRRPSPPAPRRQWCARSTPCATAPEAEPTSRLSITTGDAIDNAQWNELRMFLALFEGGLVRPGSGGPRYEGVQSLDWGDDSFWRPDGDGANVSDWYQRRYGFPHLPGLLDRALLDFHSSGLRLPWLACFGNHELLVQGLGRVD
ncbi:MAG: hypothetical protein WKF73_15445 [Nocardioidaceae bacterium]